MTATYLAVILFFTFMILGVPVSVSLMLGIVIAVLSFDVYTMLSIATLFYNSLDSYLLVAIPLFMLAGITMSYGGVAKRIFDFSEAMLSFLPGPLGSVNIVASMIFGGMSGSSVADVAGLGSIEIREMTKRGYSLEYSTAITVASSTMAVIIPPSILLIIYATIANTSVGATLAAGLLPGIMLSGLLVALNTFFAVKNKWAATSKFSFQRILKTGKDGLSALLAPVIIIGGIFSGIFTPTEASAIAFVYSLLIGIFLYKELNLKGFGSVIYEGGRTSGIVAMELAAGLLFSNLMTLDGIPQILAMEIANFSASPMIIMFMINIVLLVAGMFLNPGFSIIVFTPLLLPTAQAMGFDAMHFGVIMVTNLALGLITPPVGACLYVGSLVSGLRVEKIIKVLLPFYLVIAFALLLIILFPQMSQGFAELVF
ncbi:MAG: TRAP transporter large permease [Bacteroidetes bacterium]|nr:TRAP transporter large permease [Bacteroidota bacterium]MDA1118982.1 TRAP transporter large permease [Bacteroidota bacterium]